MKAIIELINKIEIFGDDYPEIYDTEVKELLYIQVSGILGKNAKQMNPNYGMFTAEGNEKLQTILLEFAESLGDSNLSSSEVESLLNSTKIKSARGQLLDAFWGSSFDASVFQKNGLRYFLLKFLDRSYTFPLIFFIPGAVIFFSLRLIFPDVFQNKVGFLGVLIVSGIGGLIGGAFFYQKPRHSYRC